MSKRQRNKGIYFMVSDEEREQIEENMKQAGISRIRVYLLKMALTGYIIQLDLSETRELVSMLRSVSNNMNQLAKRANETRSIYEADIVELQERYNNLWRMGKDILRTFAGLRGN